MKGIGSGMWHGSTIPTLLPALEQHGRLELGQSDRDRVLAISAPTIDRVLGHDWNGPVPGF
ncbi:hypothetical protein [Bradyrhizobium sp. CCBAU 51745]|uniref:hypothetical protein n=1 Tax=Bradyrhizobium sp. CCBAU 51745 TaxID=1325099 RepID=UPI0023064311|nr:hypothetical protein [Bradyrhizobium sp. CCBAU 51745]